MTFWRYDQVQWGVTMCEAPGCVTAADGLLDGEPYCLDHADLLVDRAAALEMDRGMVYLLPEVFG